jgi:ubiquitin-protein ligase
MGDYGTGKTYHLVEKAKELAKSGKKVAILLGNISTKHTHLEGQKSDLEGPVLLNTCLANKLEKNENIKICHLGSQFYCDPENSHQSCLKKLEELFQKEYHLFFDEFLNDHLHQQVYLTVNEVATLSKRYPDQTVWIALRPDSPPVSAKGFELVNLKTNFRNSPKIVKGVKGFLEVFFENFSCHLLSQQMCAESICVSLNRKGHDGGLPKLVVGKCCTTMEQQLELVRTALDTYKNDTVFLVGFDYSPLKMGLPEVSKIPDFTFEPILNYSLARASNTCFYQSSAKEDMDRHEIWNGIEVKNLIVYLGCDGHNCLEQKFLENLRSLMLRASVLLTVIVCKPSEDEILKKLEQSFNIVCSQPKTFEQLLMESFPQIVENPVDGVLAVPQTNNHLVWDAVIFGQEDTAFAEGIFRFTIDFEDHNTHKPPIMQFKSPMFHPNISEEGEMLLEQIEIEKRSNIKLVLTKIQSLLTEPFLNTQVNPIARRLFEENRPDYEKRVRVCVEQSWKENPNKNQVKAEMKAKLEEFLRNLEGEEEMSETN